MAKTKVLDLNALRRETAESAVSSVRVGGRNLIVGSQVKTNIKGGYSLLANEEDYQGCRIWSKRGRWGDHSFPVKVEAGKTYTFSAYVKANPEERPGLVIKFTDNDSSPSLNPVSGNLNYFPTDVSDTQFRRLAFTFVAPADCYAFGIVQKGLPASDDGDKICFGGLKMEEGNVPSDWTPAPEDYMGATASESEIFGGGVNFLSISGLRNCRVSRSVERDTIGRIGERGWLSDGEGTENIDIEDYGGSGSDDVQHGDNVFNRRCEDSGSVCGRPGYSRPAGMVHRQVRPVGSKGALQQYDVSVPLQLQHKNRLSAVHKREVVAVEADRGSAGPDNGYYVRVTARKEVVA